MTRYPAPGEAGGWLIRALVRGAREAGLELPVTSDILCAISGGSDSLALAHALVHYGRRVVSRDRIVLLHVNHGWRGKESDEDEAFVQGLADSWGVPVRVHRLKPPPREGGSPEDLARRARKRIFAEESRRAGDCPVLTAHQQDDLAETVVWRLCTGQADSHGAGILPREGCEIRPALRVRKSLLREYLREEGLEWREDRTNHEGRLLRSRMRQRLMPELEGLFPRAVEHLADAALRAAMRADELAPSDEVPALLGAAGVRLRKPHWRELAGRLAGADWRGSIDLPGGWRLTRSRPSKKGGIRWLLEKS